ncbi:DUF2267 domain-containing protein [Micromonospora purpureochromogenes]|uniref:DUF2267 domain-containing protein n=1 Tax=Micromonospora purpureochromogenes TaxID=47872 RepID=UPI0033FB0313
MDSNDFIGMVAKRANTSSARATALTRATLRTLAERIDGGEARDLATQLPEDLKAYAFASSETGERFGLDVFVQRVSGRAEVEPALAEIGMRAVFDTLRETIPPSDYDDVVSQLPAELGQVADPVAPFDGRRARG